MYFHAQKVVEEGGEAILLKSVWRKLKGYFIWQSYVIENIRYLNHANGNMLF